MNFNDWSNKCPPGIAEKSSGLEGYSRKTCTGEGGEGRGRFVTSGVELIRRAIFSSFRTTKFFYDIAFRSSVVLFLACQKKSVCEKCICVFIINGPNRWDFSVVTTHPLVDQQRFNRAHPLIREGRYKQFRD